MILEPAIANLTSNLDTICQQDGKGVSSNEKLKEKALNCLSNLIKNAPASEYSSLTKSKDSEILLGYLLSVLCRLIKDDKSRSVRVQALTTVEMLIDQLSLHHARDRSSKNQCGISALVLALPGVSSTLFKLLMSDTKLPTNLMSKSVQVLGKLIVASFSPCNHDSGEVPAIKNNLNPHLAGKNLIDTCDNISIRMSFLLNYIVQNSGNLNNDVKHEVLNICLSILREAPIELLSRLLKTFVRYTAFTRSNLDKFGGSKSEIELKLMLITDEIKHTLSNSEKNQAELESVMLKCLFEVLDNLESNSFTMLPGERQSELEMLGGLLRLLSGESMTTLLETSEKRQQLLGILISLTEFSQQQPLLFLTESHVEPNAVQQMIDRRIYTIEKRFAHLNESEVDVVNTACQLIGQAADWPLLMDIFRNDLAEFYNPSNLYVTQHVIVGCSLRPDLHSNNVGRFTTQMTQRYCEAITERLSRRVAADEQIWSDDIMPIVVAIETVVPLIQTHLKSATHQAHTVMILKDLLCPMLNWCSSCSRVVSEAALSALTQVGSLHGFASTKSLIEANTDYIIDGVSKMLDNFVCSPQVADVMAITFKLSSLQTFFYFKDVYEKVFRVLSRYHQTKSSVPLTLLLYRTVSILDGWKTASQSDSEDQSPLATGSNLRAVVDGLDIDRIVRKLQEKARVAARINEDMERMEVTGIREAEVAKQIEAGKIDMEGDKTGYDEPERAELNKARTEDSILTEKILKHCVGLMSSNNRETKILALKTAACGLRLLRDDENTLLPLVHQLWAPLLHRLSQNYMDNLEENLCAFECLVSMAEHSRDFIKRRALDSVIPKLCIFLQSQAYNSRGKKEYEPYCMTMLYKCQLKILSHLGQLAYHTQIAYTSLWRIIEVSLQYLEAGQVPSLRDAAQTSLNYLVALDADCVWFFAKRKGKLGDVHGLTLVLAT